MTLTPNLIILNGALLTFDPATAGASALAIRSGVISAIGSTAEIRALAGSETNVIDARGGTVMPGFIDSHVHLFGGAAELDMLDLRETKGRNALATALRSFAVKRPDEPLLMGVAARYDILGPGKATTRHDLDQILPERPVALMSADHHTVWANTIALERAGILKGGPVPEGSAILMEQDGTASGQLNETGAFG